MFPETCMQILDGGRAFNGGNPPAELAFNDAHVPTRRRTRRRRRSSARSRRRGSRTSSSARPRRGRSGATRRARSISAPTRRTCPPGLTKESWPSRLRQCSAAATTAPPTSSAREIYDLVRDAKITGFAIVSGDRHSFWAGYATAELPPGKFEPVGLSFVGASLTSPGAMEAYEHQPPEGSFRCGRCFSPTGPAGEAGLDLQHAAEARRPFVPRICKELRPEARACAVQPGSRSAPRVRRSGRTRLCEGPAHRR